MYFYRKRNLQKYINEIKPFTKTFSYKSTIAGFQITEDILIYTGCLGENGNIFYIR